jgi:hypothetical protein
MPATDKEIGVVALHEQFLEIPTPGGQMKTFVTRPQKGGPFAPIVIYMDIWGVREELYDIARRVATVGYCCLVPDLYYRQGHVRHAFYDDKKRMITLESLNEARKEQVRAPAASLATTWSSRIRQQFWECSHKKARCGRDRSAQLAIAWAAATCSAWRARSPTGSRQTSACTAPISSLSWTTRHT